MLAMKTNPSSAWSGSVSDAAYDEPSGVREINDLGVALEAEGRVGRGYCAIRREDERSPERDKRQIDLDKFAPGLDRARPVAVPLSGARQSTPAMLAVPGHGSRILSTPPGRMEFLVALSVAIEFLLVRKTCATFPVIVAMSTLQRGKCARAPKDPANSSA